jgi:NitT/TauT family transport system substrate-binding protein
VGLTATSLLTACAPSEGAARRSAEGASGAGGAGQPAGSGAAAAQAAPRALERVSLGTPAKAINNLPIYLAQEYGIFEDEGIDLDVHTVRGDTGVAALVSGSLDYITQTASPDALIASITGDALVSIYNMRDDPLIYLISQPYITSVQALRGGVIAHGGSRGTHYFATVAMLRHFGMDPERDVQLLSVTDVAQGIAALYADRVVAVTLVPPFDAMAVSKGYQRLVVGADVLARFPEGGLTTQRWRLREHRDQARRLVRASLRSVYYTLDHPSEAIRLIQREWDLDEATARIAYETLLPALNVEGLVSDAMWEAGVKRAIQEGQVDRPNIRPQDYADWSLVREVQPTLKR